MQRHPPLIEKDDQNEDDEVFWKAVKKYITPNISNEYDVDFYVDQILSGEISDILPIEFVSKKKKLCGVVSSTNIEDNIINYNILLGKAHYLKLIEKKISLKNFY